MADVRDVNEANRQAFSRAETVGDYAAMAGPTSAERTLFQAYVPRGSLVLDLGVGTGRTTEMLQALADRYVGVTTPKPCSAAPVSTTLTASSPSLTRRICPSSTTRRSTSVCLSYNGIDYLHPDDTRRRCLAEVARVLVPGAASCARCTTPMPSFDHRSGHSPHDRSQWRRIRPAGRAAVRLGTSRVAFG